MTFGQFLAVLRARWLPAFALFLVVFIGAVVVTARAPKTYEATAAVVIDARPDPVSSMLYGGYVSPALINTQVEVMHSDRVALRVAKALKLDEDPKLRAAWQSGAEKSSITLDAFLAEFLQRGMKAFVTQPGGNVVNITYRGTDPKRAAEVANAYTQAYIDTTVQMRVDPAKEYTGFFGEQARDAREALEKAQAKLSAFQQAKGIIATDDRYDVETNRLNLLTGQLVTMQTMAADSSSRQAQAAANGDRLQEVLGNSVIASLKSEVSRAEASLQEMNSRLGENHPQVQQARANLGELRRRLAAETSTVTAGVGVSARIDRAREGELMAQVEAQRQKVLRLKEVRDEGAVLARDVENAQRAYDLVLNRFNQSNLESQNKQSGVSILSPASVPQYPVSPKVTANLLMGLVFGAALGLGLAFLLEQFDKRVRTASEAFNAVGVPVIGVMPTPLLGKRKRTQLALTQQRVIFGRRLPSPGKGPA